MKIAMKLGMKIQILTAVPLVLFAFFVLYSTYTNTNTALMREKEIAIESIISTSLTAVEMQYRQYKKGLISEAEAKKEQLSTLQRLSME